MTEQTETTTTTKPERRYYDYQQTFEDIMKMVLKAVNDTWQEDRSAFTAVSYLVDKIGEMRREVALRRKFLENDRFIFEPKSKCDCEIKLKAIKSEVECMSSDVSSYAYDINAAVDDLGSTHSSLEDLEGRVDEIVSQIEELLNQ